VKRFVVELSERAERDFDDMDEYISTHAGERIAAQFIERILTRLSMLETAPERGTLREELGKGVRSFGVERRVTVLIKVEARRVVVLRVLYGGRSLGGDG
jgi:plasmid stabilization system protein ParE